MTPFTEASLQASGLFQDVDLRFADLMHRLAGDGASGELLLAAALVSTVTTDEKHVCFDLQTKAGLPLGEIFPGSAAAGRDELCLQRLPAYDAWRELLLRTAVVGSPGDYRPLILDGRGRLYLYRYWQYEQQLAAAIRRRVFCPSGEKVNLDLLRRGLAQHFSSGASSPDWQKAAAFAALTGRFCIISGGPGTGKTFTVSVIMRLLLEQNSSLKIRLCAPTGKASARLAESVRPVREGAGMSGAVSTIHRLLGHRHNSPYFQHSRSNPLPADAVIVDEASMVPLALMAKLFEALPDRCRIILLGDKDQLASVEAGSVLGDICEASRISRFSPDFCSAYAAAGGEEIPPAYCSTEASALSDCTVELLHSYRFAEAPAIGAVSAAVNRGDYQAALASAAGSGADAVSCIPLPVKEDLEKALSRFVLAWYEPVFAAAAPEEAYACFCRFRILCPYRHGPYGVENINALAENILKNRGYISSSGGFYRGRPLMITRNDYTVKLFNGDTGIIWAEKAGETAAYFPGETGGLRQAAPGRLPCHETAYAMTMHKSQGSEFDNVLIVLPERDAPLLTREILYTGITRTRKRIELWAD